MRRREGKAASAMYCSGSLPGNGPIFLRKTAFEPSRAETNPSTSIVVKNQTLEVKQLISDFYVFTSLGSIRLILYGSRLTSFEPTSVTNEQAKPRSRMVSTVTVSNEWSCPYG